ncbi:MAG: toll/interleukin-1 receptor domain-containing protein [Algoriphagus sp.]|nr:toll/interleukin-1 receptor domain-containing protein [Algoriphagus sp.]
MADHQVFISYAWGGESEVVANEIEAELIAKSIHLVRDKADLGFKGLIREFMEKIGQGNLVVLIISDKYLKSKNCMFELLEVEKKGEFYGRVFPVVLPDANIYDALGIINYLKYWDQKIKELNESVKALDNLADTRKVQEDINLYTDIRGAIDSLAGKLSNMNTLTLEIMRSKHYQPLTEALQIQNTNLPQPVSSGQPGKKQGKVLYHIPGMMQVEKWTRCTVRLAWEEIFLTEGLAIPEEERAIESIRLGNVMQVSLEESRNGQNFEIEALNNNEQLIFEDDFTEWLFDVKPKREGTFTLVLRVTLIQIVEGFERKKDIVLERNVKTEAIVPDALQKFEIAEEGLPAPETHRKGEKSKKLEKKSGKNTKPDLKHSKPLPEFERDLKESTISPKVSNRPSSSKSPSIPPSPSLAPPSSHAEPNKVKPTGLRKILPYAASVAALVVVGLLFFSEMGYKSSSSNGEYTASSPDTGEGEAGYQGEKFLLAMSLDATSPTGEQVTEVMLFLIKAEEMDSLHQIDPGQYSMEVFPASDTVILNLGPIQNYTIMEIRDSVQKASVRPVEVGNQLIDKRELQINPGTQILSRRPQPIDSTTAEKIRIGTKKSREN